MDFSFQVYKIHSLDGLIDKFPKENGGISVGDNVVLGQRRRILIQRIGTANQTVAVIVDVANADLDLTLPKDP